MNSCLQNQRRASVKGSFQPRSSGILQRKCACGQHTGGGECEPQFKHRALNNPNWDITPGGKEPKPASEGQ